LLPEHDFQQAPVGLLVVHDQDARGMVEVRARLHVRTLLAACARPKCRLIKLQRMADPWPVEESSLLRDLQAVARRARPGRALGGSAERFVQLPSERLRGEWLVQERD